MTQDSLIYIVGTGVVGALTSAVVYLHGRSEKKSAETELRLQKQISDIEAKAEKAQLETKQDLKECREDRELLHQKIHDLAMQFAQVRKDQA